MQWAMQCLLLQLADFMWGRARVAERHRRRGPFRRLASPGSSLQEVLWVMKPPISMSRKGTAEQDLRHSEVSEQWEQMTVAHWLSVHHASCKEQLQGSWSV